MELHNTPVAAPSTTTSGTKGRFLKKTNAALWFLLPSLVILAVFTFYPMIMTAIESLFSTNVRGELAQFVGFSNYAEIFSDPLFLKSLVNTFIFVITAGLGTIALALFLASMVTEKMRGSGFFRTAFASTMGISGAVASVLFLFLFNPSVGVLGILLKDIGVKQNNLVADPTGAMIILVVVSIWMGTGFSFLNLLGALQSVPADYYAVADLAGWSSWQKTWKITIPMVSPTLFFLLVVEIIGKFKTFTEIDLITGGGPDNATNFIAYKVYTDAFGNRNFGIAASEALVLTAIIAFATWFQFRFTERKVYYK
ncbi:ABC transporter permease subunit [Schleiferilactobacillus harbinensis]|uniref:ABC-type sugar transport system, permease component n=1 Tax=Schleiferilactobacillus harbinensis DSM 16991 TaxID=1122147 RepID=A0A0R1XFY1_9LACO|nr:sugar ABC transporter permease [Schleiferilactobacillus harbinensis]KRM27083.1 ABC-type sugar transport system, permease component [Schleiferilactobacillus harbinensis DSM 16991]QFR63757.1 ABC transporter permease subunit [Schleiferilactobacillus harbinensis]